VSDERGCEGCRWRYGMEDDINRSLCLSPKTEYLFSKRNREFKDGCGPTGRYWEPREDADVPI